MNISRNWKGLDSSADEGQKTLLDMGWLTVTVKRVEDNNRNVGITAELDDDIITFTIKARIDPLENKQGTRYWIGLVELEMLPMMQKKDHWLVQKPNNTIEEYTVKSINADEIILEKL